MRPPERLPALRLDRPRPPAPDYQKLVIDLKPFRGGRQAVGDAVQGQAVSVPQVLEDRSCPTTTWRLSVEVRLGPVQLGRLRLDRPAANQRRRRPRPSTTCSASRIAVRLRVEASGSRAVERYRPTYESLLDGLADGPLVHADETKVEIKGPAQRLCVGLRQPGDGGVRLRPDAGRGRPSPETLTGFKGVLVSDFYAAYDSLECPQQKCLIHLIRDLNDDLLKNPFDEELKQLAARFTAVLQPMIATIDRYGLKKYHLGKHKTGRGALLRGRGGGGPTSRRWRRHYRSRLAEVPGQAVHLPRPRRRPLEQQQRRERRQAVRLPAEGRWARRSPRAGSGTTCCC